MAKIPGLQRRGLTWFLRVRVPKDVEPHFKSKEINQTLGTRDYSEAAKRVHAVRTGIEAEFEKMRQAKKAETSDKDMLSGYSEHQLRALVIKWLNDIRAKEEKRRALGMGGWTEERKRDYYDELRLAEHNAREEVQGMNPPDRHDGLTMAARFLKAEGITYSNPSESFFTLGHLFSKAMHERAQQSIRQFEGKVHIPNPEFAGAIHYESSAPPNAIRMGDLVKEFVSDPKLRRTELAKKNYRVIVRAIEEVIGFDTFAHQVTREQCKAISALLMALPSNASKKIKAKTLADAVAIGEAKGMPKISDSTYNTYMQKLNAIMEYAVHETYIAVNPARKLSVPSAMKDKDRRNPFALTQLQAIFGSEYYRGLKETAAIYQASNPSPKVYGHFWIPLIGLWSGMRLNEICQLHVSDIKLIDNVRTVMVREDTDDVGGEDAKKKVKTGNAVRMLPIHPKLLDAGFLEYVESIQKAGKTRIFPHLTLDSRGYYSHEYSKWFTRYLGKINAKAPRTSYHSFRHNFRDAIRRAKLPRDETLHLGGWSSGATDDAYGSGSDIRDLYEALCKVKYEGLDLSHVCD